MKQHFENREYDTLIAAESAFKNLSENEQSCQKALNQSERSEEKRSF